MPAPIGNENHLKHGHAKKGRRSAEYTAWRNMLNRCFYKKSDHYHLYGLRGITVCRRWLRFEKFLADMGKRPLGKTLERKDNDGNYGPTNCVWATRSEQARNRRVTELRRASLRNGWIKRRARCAR